MELRSDNIQGTKTREDEARCDASHFVSESAETYDDIFEEGYFVPLRRFATERGITRENEAELIKYITEELHLDVEKGANGLVGVYVPDVKVGAGYKVPPRYNKQGNTIDKPTVR